MKRDTGSFQVDAWLRLRDFPLWNPQLTGFRVKRIIPVGAAA